MSVTRKGGDCLHLFADVPSIRSHPYPPYCAAFCEGILLSHSAVRSRRSKEDRTSSRGPWWRRLNCPSPLFPVWVAGSAHSITRTPKRWNVLSEPVSWDPLISPIPSTDFTDDDRCFFILSPATFLERLFILRVNPWIIPCQPGPPSHATHNTSPEMKIIQSSCGLCKTRARDPCSESTNANILTRALSNVKLFFEKLPLFSDRLLKRRSSVRNS